MQPEFNVQLISVTMEELIDADFRWDFPEGTRVVDWATSLRLAGDPVLHSPGPARVPLLLLRVEHRYAFPHPPGVHLTVEPLSDFRTRVNNLIEKRAKENPPENKEIPSKAPREL